MHWEPMTLSANEQAYAQHAVKAAYEKQEKRETFDYTPGFKWLEFRVGHNYYAQQSDWTTQTLMRVSNHL